MSSEHLSKLTQVAIDKQDFILNSTIAGEAKSVEEKAEMEAAWPAAISFLNTLNSSQIASIEGLRSFDGQAFCGTTVSELLFQLDALAALSGDEFRLADLAKMAVNIVESTEDTATLEVSIPGEEPDIATYTNVNGRWLAKDLASGWADGVALAKANLSS